MTARAAPPTERTVTLDIALLGRDFKVACKESERAELQEAVALLDRRMREIRDGGKIAGAERIAVMAALNMANDLLRERRAAAQAPAATVAATAAAPLTGIIDEAPLRRRISGMQSAIDQLLAAGE